MPQQNVTVNVVSKLGRAQAFLAIEASTAETVERQAPRVRQTATQETVPELLSVDGSGSGQGLVVDERGLATLPRAGLDGAPAIPGEAVKFYATGVDCQADSGKPAPVLYFDGRVRPVAALSPTTLAGVCEITAVVPAGSVGSRIAVAVETISADGIPARSNAVLLAVDE